MEGHARCTTKPGMTRWTKRSAVEDMAGDEVRGMPVRKGVHRAFVGSLIKGFSFSLEEMAIQCRALRRR